MAAHVAKIWDIAPVVPDNYITQLDRYDIAGSYTHYIEILPIDRANYRHYLIVFWNDKFINANKNMHVAPLTSSLKMSEGFSESKNMSIKILVDNQINFGKNADIEMNISFDQTLYESRNQTSEAILSPRELNFSVREKTNLSFELFLGEANTVNQNFDQNLDYSLGLI